MKYSILIISIILSTLFSQFGENHPELELSTYGFSERDLNKNIFLDNNLGFEFASLGQVMDLLKRTYCSSIGFEYMHISSPEENMSRAADSPRQ